MRDTDAFWLFDQGGVKDERRTHRLASMERVDDAMDAPGLYVARCDCGWESEPKSQAIVHGKYALHAHVKERA